MALQQGKQVWPGGSRKNLPSLERSSKLLVLACFASLDSFKKGTNVGWEAKGHWISLSHVAQQRTEDAGGWRGLRRSSLGADMTEPLPLWCCGHGRVQTSKMEGSWAAIAAKNFSFSTAGRAILVVVELHMRGLISHRAMMRVWCSRSCKLGGTWT